MKYQFLEAWVEDQILYVLLDHLENKNRFDSSMAQDLMNIAREASLTDDLKVIVLGSSGEHFSLGFELEPEASEPTDESYSSIHLADAAIEEWARLPYPILVAINGHCSSIGLSLACVADIRYANSNAIFSVPEPTWGLVPAGGITQRLPRLIGKTAAFEMLLSGKAIQANTAQSLGLVNKVTNEDVWKIACDEAKRLANLSTLSLQYTKECIIRGSELPLEQALRLELDIYMLLQTSKDRMEGVHAFLEKRQANFIGE